MVCSLLSHTAEDVKVDRSNVDHAHKHLQSTTNLNEAPLFG
jgi:hypothetical protein